MIEKFQDIFPLLGQAQFEPNDKAGLFLKHGVDIIANFDPEQLVVTKREYELMIALVNNLPAIVAWRSGDGAWANTAAIPAAALDAFDIADTHLSELHIPGKTFVAINMYGSSLGDIISKSMGWQPVDGEGFADGPAYAGVVEGRIRAKRPVINLVGQKPREHGRPRAFTKAHDLILPCTEEQVNAALDQIEFEVAASTHITYVAHVGRSVRLTNDEADNGFVDRMLEDPRILSHVGSSQRDMSTTVETFNCDPRLSDDEFKELIERCLTADSTFKFR
jgi:hypothetical protein